MQDINKIFTERNIEVKNKSENITIYKSITTSKYNIAKSKGEKKKTNKFIDEVSEDNSEIINIRLDLVRSKFI